jgi:alkanesulfonate monooxygenase SsuD/methylene tetrahydromethanopterin reductase-like flavin-dependent oxidoreductase (luciferase family)
MPGPDRPERGSRLAMEFGVFQGASVGPRPWDESEPRRLRNDVEIGIAADRAGFDTFWAPEHHCLEEYSHNSCSHLSCLAVGMKTERIRLVTGIFNLCPPINHPVRVAEQIATIDILTHGRVELGTGRGSGSTEVNTFGITNEESRGMWDEAIRAIPQMWTRELFSWQGKYFSVPERCILPKPVQKPHPPLWVTTSNPPTIEIAARMGLGVAMFNFSDPELLRPAVERYKDAIEKAEPVGAFVNNKIMTIAPLLCLEDGDRARALFARKHGDVSAHFSVYFDTILANAERLKDEPRPMSQRRVRELIRQAARSSDVQGPMARGEITREFLLRNGMCVGDPQDVIRTVERFRQIGLDQLVFVPVIGWGHELHEVSLESVALAGERVLPAFRGAAAVRS